MSLAIAAGLAGLVAYYASPGGETSPNPTEKSRMTNAAIARIAAESRGTLREPPIQAAPRSSETPSAVDGPVGDSRPSPPDGYSFVSYHGEMPRARIEGEIDAGGEGAGTDLDWLGSTTSIEMLVTQAVAAGRDWSFGWIRLAEGARGNDLARSLQGSGAEVVGSAGRLMRAIASLSLEGRIVNRPFKPALTSRTCVWSDRPACRSIPEFASEEGVLPLPTLLRDRAHPSGRSAGIARISGLSARVSDRLSFSWCFHLLSALK